jgi:SAM-dependent methyltransferase
MSEASIGAEVLREQYGDDSRLAARQSLWAGRTGPSLYETVLDLTCLSGTESIVDIGCGNGAYLAELRRRGHTGPLLAVDRSAAMARGSSRYAHPAVADAQALPVRSRGVDVALCAHMLYHVPDLPLAVGELRRVLRPGGKAVITTNGPGHTAQAKAVMVEAVSRVTGVDMDPDWDTRRFDPRTARDLLRASFDEVDGHELRDSTPVPDKGIVSAYLASWPPESAGLSAGPVWRAVLAAADELLDAHYAMKSTMDMDSRVAVFVCR